MKKKRKLSFINITLVLSTIVYTYFSYKNKMIPLKYQIFLFVIVLSLFFFGAYFKNKVIKLFMVILIISLSFLHLKAQDLLSQIFLTNNFLGNKSASISMIALKEQEVNGEFYKNARYSTSYELDVDFHQYIYDDIVDEFKIVPNMQSVNYNKDMANNLFNGDIDIMILDESQRSELLIEYPDFNETTQILRTFTKDIIIESNAKKVNPTKESFIILLTANDNWGEEDPPQSLADVNILAIVNPKLEYITLVSVPRDTFVPLSCQDGAYDKLTHTGIYGMDCQIETLNDFLDIEINYYAKVNFGTLLNVINILGGSVNIYNPYAFQGHTEEYYFEEGCLNLDALATLNYVRTRYELPDGDFGRQENQKRVIKSLISKITTPQRILNMGSIFSALSKEIETSIDVDFVNSLISYQLDKWPNWQLESVGFTGLDGEEITYSYPYEYLYVFFPFLNEVEDTKENIKQFMNANDISEVDFLNTESNQSNNSVEIENGTSDPSHKNDDLTTNQEPEVEIYEPIIDYSIYKYGIQIKPFDLVNQSSFTKQQYIEACEQTFGQ